MEMLMKMPWQDWVFCIGQLFLFAALIPSIITPHKPALSTSIMTGTILATFTVSFYSLGFWFSAFSAGLTTLAWYILAFQKAQQIQLQKQNLKKQLG